MINHKVSFPFLMIICFFITSYNYGQDFINGDLEGTISLSAFPPGWSMVPATDPACLSTNSIYVVPDVCGLTGPVVGAGIAGQPFSDTCFVSGQHSESFSGIIYHEGIQQTVNGLVVGENYTLNFHQCVVKQSNCLDESGSWSVYMDNVLLGVTAVSVSIAPFDTLGLNWEFRNFLVTPTATSHTFKFLPTDDDANQISTTTDITGGLRMGIDSVFLKPDCFNSVDLGMDTVLCITDTLSFELNNYVNFSYLWSTGTTDSIETFNSTGEYWIQLDSGICVYTDTINITFFVDSLDLGNDTTLCFGTDILLESNILNTTNIWNDILTDTTLLISISDTVWLDVSLGTCMATDTIIIDFYNLDSTFLGPDTTICPGFLINLETTFFGESYLWNDNSTDSILNTGANGIYWLDVLSNGCLNSDTIQISQTLLPSLNIGNDTTICNSDTLKIVTLFNNATYLWSDASTDSIINITQSGQYWLEIMIDGCTISDTININYFNPPNGFGNDTTLCQGSNILLDVTSPGVTYLWNDLSVLPTNLITAADTISVIVTDNTCPYYDTIIVDYFPTITGFLGNDTSFCVNDSILIQSNLSGDSYLWSDLSNDTSNWISTPSTIWVDISLNGCLYTDTIEIFNYPILFPNLGNDTTICIVDSILLDATMPNVSYLWSDLSTDSVLNVVQAGQYWIDIIQNGCIYTDTIQIDTFAIPIINLGNDTTLCQGTDILLDITIAGVTYVWNDLSVLPTNLISSADTISVILTENACAYYDTIIIDYYPAITGFLGNDTSFCVNDSILIQSNLSGDSYLWSDLTSDTSNWISTPSTIWVDVSLNGCMYSDTIELFNYPILFPNLGNDTTLCISDSVLLDATMPNVSYLWSDLSTDSVLNVVQAGQYWIDIIQNGCIYTDTIQIDTFATPIFNLGNDTTLCQGADILLDVTTAGATYVWDDLSILPTILISSADTISVILTENTCAYYDTIIIDYYPAITGFLGNDTSFCVNDSILIQTNLSGDSYLWSDLTSDTSNWISTPSTIWVDVSLNGCMYSDTIELFNYPILFPNLGNDTTLCISDSVLLDATMPNVSYLWSDLSTDSVLNVVQAGQYWIDIIQNGCIYTDTIQIDTFATPIFNLGNDTTLCQGEDILLDATTAGVTYLWNDLSVLPTNLITASDTVSVIITENTCSYFDTIIVDYYTPINLNIGNDTVFCFGDSLILNEVIPNANFLWSDLSTNDSLIIYNTSQIWLDLEQNGCLYSDTINVLVNSLPTLNLGNDTNLCTGNTIVLDAGNIGSIYEWQDLSSIQTLNVISGGQYFVEVTDANSCMAFDTININEINLSVDFGSNYQLICANESLLLDAENIGANYQWQNNSSSSSFMVEEPGLYFVEVELGNCFAFDTIEIEYTLLNASFNVSLESCFGAELQFNNTSSSSINDNIVSYHWSFGDNGYSNIESPLYVYSYPGLFNAELIIETAFGCVDSFSFGDNIQVNQNPIADFVINPTQVFSISPQAHFFNQSSGENSWYWSFDDLGFSSEENPSFTFPLDIATTYNVNLIVEDEKGCKDSISKEFETIEPITFYVPNAFTPSNGNINNEFKPIFTSGFDPYKYHFTIFNRWGEVIYESYDSESGWNGVYNRIKVETGVYVWKIDYKNTIDDENYTKIGHVTVIN